MAHPSEKHHLRSWLGATHERLYYLLALLLPAVFFLSNETTKTFRDLIALLFLIGILRWKKWFRADHVVWFVLMLAAVIVGGYIWQVNSIPPDIFGGSQARKYIIAFGFFVVLAYGSIAWKRIPPTAFLVSAALGLLIHLAFNVPPEQWLQAWRGRRIDLGFLNAQHAGIIFSTGLLATGFLAPRAVLKSSPRTRPWLACACIAFFTLMLWGTLVTQVRAVWIGLACAVLACVALTLIIPRTRQSLARTPYKWQMLAGVITFTIAIVVVFQPIDQIKQRLIAENVSAKSIMGAAQFERKYMTSSGIRIASWVAAKDWIMERPFLGWGTHSVKQLLQQNPELEKLFQSRFGHLHNSYLDIMVAVGLVAAFLMLAIIVSLVRMTATHWRERRLPTDAMLFLFCFLVFWAVVNIFESYLNYRSGFFVHTLICTFAYALCLQCRRPQKSAD